MKKNSPLILASSSPFRKELLSRLGFEFQTAAPNLDETLIQNKTDLTPKEKVEQLSRAKGEKVLNDYPEACVIASDQMICLGEKIFNRPHTRAKAAADLKELSGKTHQLLTGLFLATKTETLLEVHTAELTMRNLTEQDIETYLDTEDTLACAGSYKIEGRGIRLFEKILCEDWNTIVGLPLMRINKLLVGSEWGKAI